MKILFMSGNLCDGGAQRVISVVASQLVEQGRDVSLYLFSRNKNEYPISDKVKITAMGEDYQGYSAIPGPVRVANIRKYLKETKPDVAVAFLEAGYALLIASVGLNFLKVASARIDPKVIMTAHGFRARLTRMWFRSADAIVLQTESQKRHVPGSMLNKSTVIANPVSDLALSGECPIYQENCRRIVMAGRLAEQKNYPMMLEAMSLVRERYPDATLHIYGKGGLEKALGRDIREMRLETCVALRGWTQDTLSAFRSSDLYVLSSDYEGMPNSLMEAMAVGLPCISTDCETGPGELIRCGENGFLTPVGDARAMADRLLMLMAMSVEERRALGQNARKTILDGYTSGAIAGKWAALLAELVDRR